VGDPEFGSAANALALGGSDGGVGFLIRDVGAAFDLYERQPLSPDGDEVDFTCGCFPPRFQDAVSAQAEREGCNPL
jgi:hypothetical protein